MSAVVYNTTIYQAQVKSMLFRTCAKCKSKVQQVAINYAKSMQTDLFCRECRKPISDTKATYRLQFTAINPALDKLEVYNAYDGAVEPIMGCSAGDLVKRLGNEPELLDKIEGLFINLHCHLLLRPIRPKKGRSSDPSSSVVETILPLCAPDAWLPFVQRLDRINQQITLMYNPSLSHDTP